jgi:DNA-binding PadR family transcriptional regulator
MKGNVDPLLLCVIGQQPMYGYQIYPALHRLERAHLIQGKWQLLPSGQQRKYYYITDKGLSSLAEKRHQWQAFLAAMNLIIQPA